MNLEFWMDRALQEAQKGSGRVAPNPLVGAVLVKNNRLIATGHHEHFGGMHAEEIAIRKAGKKAQGSSLFVTLEPCHHFGKRPPCTKLILESGIKKVVCAGQDNSLKSKTKSGLNFLKKSGVKVIEGVLKQKANQLNWIYLDKHKNQRPLFILKMASTLDGKIATASGESKWITGPESRKKVQELRSKVDAVLVGIETVIKDNPSLLVKKASSLNQPLRIILDSKLRIPFKSQVLDIRKGKTLIVTTKQAPQKKINMLRAKGIGVKILKSKNNHIDLTDFKNLIKKWNMNAILVEGGAEIAASFLNDHLITHVFWFIAPKIMGGQYSKSAVGGTEIKKLTQAIQLHKAAEIEKLGEDLLLSYSL